MRRRLGLLVATLAVARAAVATPGAVPAPAAAATSRATSPSHALFRLDPLGLSPEIVQQLEAILRIELARAVGSALPSRGAVQAVLDRDRRLAACSGAPDCVAPLARGLGVARVVVGTVAGLGDSYVIDLKVVDAGGGERGRVRATLRGSVDELIQEVRLATYRLVAPERLVGSISLLSEIPNADVFLDGRAIGRTPLAAPLVEVAVGDHTLRVARAGWSDFEERVPVRFEKATEVIVRQRAVSVEARLEEEVRREPRIEPPPYWSRWWFITAAAGVALGGGIVVGGLAAPRQDQEVVR